MAQSIPILPEPFILRDPLGNEAVMLGNREAEVYLTRNLNLYFRPNTSWIISWETLPRQFLIENPVHGSCGFYAALSGRRIAKFAKDVLAAIDQRNPYLVDAWASGKAYHHHYFQRRNARLGISRREP